MERLLPSVFGGDTGWPSGIDQWLGPPKRAGKVTSLIYAGILRSPLTQTHVRGCSFVWHRLGELQCLFLVNVKIVDVRDLQPMSNTCATRQHDCWTGLLRSSEKNALGSFIRH